MDGHKQVPEQLAEGLEAWPAGLSLLRSPSTAVSVWGLAALQSNPVQLPAPWDEGRGFRGKMWMAERPWDLLRRVATGGIRAGGVASGLQQEG